MSGLFFATLLRQHKQGSQEITPASFVATHNHIFPDGHFKQTDILVGSGDPQMGNLVGF